MDEPVDRFDQQQLTALARQFALAALDEILREAEGHTAAETDEQEVAAGKAQRQRCEQQTQAASGGER
jgi:hypothetical protein